MKRILLLLAAVALLAIGCKKTPEINNLGESKIILPAEGGSAYLNFGTNCAWDANVLDAWAQITPISGPANANAKITVTAAANTGSAPRSTTLTVIAAGAVLQVTVTQGVAAIPVVIPVASISVLPTEAVMNEGDQLQLTATVLPENATDKTVVWTSSAPETASVENGVVTANSAGEATITASAGGKSATCSITVQAVAVQGTDIGLSVLWGDRNLGAKSPEEYGDYYAWGELEPKTTYTWDNYTWAGQNKYNTIEYYPGGGYSHIASMEIEDDAASQKLGYRIQIEGDTYGYWTIPDRWRMNELLETREKTDTYRWEWKTIKGHSGWQITYLVNGNSIFLPAAGYIYEGSEVSGDGEIGLYWTADPLFENDWTSSASGTNLSYFLWFEAGDNGEVVLYNDGQRAAGKTIRAVYHEEIAGGK